ncbi:hypothetical protein D3C76_1032670 [compost metagenome]
MQPAHAGRGVSINAVATAVGFSQSILVNDQDGLEKAIDTLYSHQGPVTLCVKVTTDPAPTALPPRDGPYLRSRFREALMGSASHV